MIQNADSQLFISKIKDNFFSKKIIKISISKPTSDTELKNIFIRPIELRGIPFFSVNFRRATSDETKNLSWEEAADFFQKMLGVFFLQATLFAHDADVTLLFSKKRKTTLLNAKPSHSASHDFAHDRSKKRRELPNAARYLNPLGVTNPSGEPLAAGQKKFRQIHKYIEIIESLLREHQLPPSPYIADMGCGKGYLTFALFDFLKNNLQLAPQMTGIELRPELVDFCKKLNQQVGFDGLDFIAQDINFFQPPRLDMLIALHACDTATDVAIAKGIKAGAEWIVVAPCCHKQVRKQLDCKGELAPLLTHGILAERQSELVTDGIRALLLEAHGYRTKVFEFISVEHTAKNLMITAMKTPRPHSDALGQVAAIKAQFGIKSHALEELLKENQENI